MSVRYRYANFYWKFKKKAQDLKIDKKAQACALVDFHVFVLRTQVIPSSFDLSFKISLLHLNGSYLSLSVFPRWRLSFVSVSLYALSLFFCPCCLSEFTVEGPRLVFFNFNCFGRHETVKAKCYSRCFSRT